jgi:hypothetical protein
MIDGVVRNPVMAGLDPAIQIFPVNLRPLDGRVERPAMTKGGYRAG